MNILIVRHGIAEDRVEFARGGRSDDERPLTKKGIERMRESARGLKNVVPEIDLIATSPLVRAHQTADIIRKAYKSKLTQIPELAPGQGPVTVTEWLQSGQEGENLCLVGHEPDLSELVAWLTSGRTEGYVDMKKGAACMLSSYGAPQRAACQLLWMLTPKQLRQLAGAR